MDIAINSAFKTHHSKIIYRNVASNLGTVPDFKASGTDLVVEISLKTSAITGSRTAPEYFKCSADNPISINQGLYESFIAW